MQRLSKPCVPFAPECLRPYISAAAGFKFTRYVFAAVPAEFAGAVFDAPIFEFFNNKKAPCFPERKQGTDFKVEYIL
jgi:hypothetical protein